jgi:hypothetical protein
VIEKRLTSNAAGDSVLTITVTGAYDAYRFAHGMRTLQCEFARKGQLALDSLRRQLGRRRYGFIVDACHGDGRHFAIDRRSPYARGYEDAIRDARALVALALVVNGAVEDELTELIPQEVWDGLYADGLVSQAADITGEHTAFLTPSGRAALAAAVEERTPKAVAA